MVGKSFPRIDIPAKVSGTYTYIQNVRIPGMLHAPAWCGRAAPARTRSQNARPLSVDESSIKHIPGARSCRSSNFIAVVARRSTTRSRRPRS